MKKVFATSGLLAIIITLLSFTIPSEKTTSDSGISFFNGTLAEAKAQAKKEGKLVFIDAYTVWCGPCKWMAKNTFTDAEVGKYFNDNFISVKVDCEKGEGLTFARDFRIRAYPTLVVIDHNGTEKGRSLGAKQVDQLMAFGKSFE